MNIIRISDLSGKELEIYKNRNESQLYHINEPDPGIFIAESPNVITRALADEYEPISFLVEEHQWKEEIKEITKDYDVPVYLGSHEALLEIVGFEMARGLLCAMKRRELPSIEELCKDKRRIAVLDDVENPTNIGAIFRSAAALGMEAVILTKGSSDPLYRRAARVSMGTVFQVPWTFEKEGDYMKSLGEIGFKTVAMALREDSVSISDEKLKSEEKLAIILGNEGYGLEDETIASCDYVAKIPMTNGVDSLNVAAASAVMFWELGEQ
ncbi:MAG: RNA methyltransferase [Lachnospiraceae bacterium]|nr:RNA methyltransferase [Lachnospiraceae bacterium]